MPYTNNFSRDNIFNFYGLNNTNLNVSISVDELRKSINSLKMASPVALMASQMKC